MNPLYFGTSEEPLFGVYHPPHAEIGREVGVLLCYPMGQEYMRAHRAFRQFALLLSRAGFHVMRFDYFGTGDSAGDGSEATVERWVEDIACAIDELKDSAGVERVAVVGLRLGGTLAAVACGNRDDVDQLVLWDPILSGKQYVAELMREHAGEVFAEPTAADPEKETATVGVMGFPITRRIRRALWGLELAGVSLRGGLQTLIVVSAESERHRSLVETFGNSGVDASFLCVASEGNWNEVDDFGSALIPQAIIRAIVNYLSEKTGQ
jgi:pimeloyl-ACP methyl ester carboxylesterase